MSGDFLFSKRRPLVMGILNVTTDSFSGDGLLQRDKPVVQFAVDQALRMIADGADILDIGGESTRPGYKPVSEEEELERVVPVVEALRKVSETPLSVDTFKPRVAEAALSAGARILNDISGIAADPALYECAAKHKSYLVLMHNRSRTDAIDKIDGIGGAYQAPVYDDIIEAIKADFEIMIAKALKAGVEREKLILDPGIGFGKTVEHNLRLVNELDRFKSFGLPLLMGVSRKSFIGQVLNAPPEDRLEGTAAAVAVSVMRGADIVRVHDVKAMARVVKMASSVLSASG